MAAAIPAQVSDFLNYKALDLGMPESTRDSYSTILCEFYAFLEMRPRPTAPEPTAPDSAKSQSPYDHVLAYLESALAHEPNPHFRADLQQAMLYVYFESQQNPIAFVEASYVVHGSHPDKLWPQIIKNRKGILGPEYERWYDAAGKLIPEPLDIPDYDPTSGLAPRLQHRQTIPPTISVPKTAWPKAPLRLVVSRSEARKDTHVIYEQLQCGHWHIEFLGANPGNRRRRCHQCSERTLAQISKKPVQSVRSTRKKLAA